MSFIGNNAEGKKAFEQTSVRLIMPITPGRPLLSRVLTAADLIPLPNNSNSYPRYLKSHDAKSPGIIQHTGIKAVDYLSAETPCSTQ
jgi:hypothetical protein